MLKLFDNHQFATFPLVVVYTGLLGTAAFKYLPLSSELDLSAGPWGLWPWWSWGWQAIFWLMFWWFSVLGFNALVNEFRLAKHLSYVTAPVLSLMFLSLPDLIRPDSALLSLPAWGFGLWCLFASAEQKGAWGLIYNAGLGVGLSYLFHLPSLGLWPVFLLGLYLLRSWDWREQFALVLGIATPIWLFATWIYVDSGAWPQGLLPHTHWPPWEGLAPNPWHYVSLGFWLILLLWSLVNYRPLLNKLGLREQKCIQIIFLHLFFAPLVFVFSPNIAWADFTLLALPLGLLLSFHLHFIEDRASAELIHGLLLAYVLMIQFLV